MPDGTQITTRGLEKRRVGSAFFIRARSICSAASKSAITPSWSGRIAVMPDGVRPMVRLASDPTAITSPDAFTATTDGSFRTTPLPRE